MSYKVDYFKQELNWIKNQDIRKYAEIAIESLPDYFFKIPASSTGKYHPNYSLGDGGLARHCRAIVRVAIEMSRVEMFNISSDELDWCIVGAFVHDGWKSGIVQTKFSVFDHPLIAAKMLKENQELKNLGLNDEAFLGMIESHMGGNDWNVDYRTGRELPKPKTKLEKFFHICDYIASRKCLEMNFDVAVSR
jgi:hypothetical protein